MTKVLVIDDDPEVRSMLAELLELEGFSAMTAADGAAGLKRVGEQHPDLILCDVMMPGLDGYGVLRALRADPTTALIPLMYLTAKTDRDDVRFGMDLGADDYLTKPVSTTELVKAIRARLSKLEEARREAVGKLTELRESISNALPHEFLTPLTAVIGLSDFMREHGASMTHAEVREIAEVILKGGRQLEGLIARFLVYVERRLAAVEAERARAFPRVKASDPGTMLTQVVSEKAGPAGREPDVEAQIDKIPVPLTDEHLRDVVRELLDNALRFSDPGTPVLLRGSREGARWVLAVTDAGRGMTPAQVASIGPYVQFGRKVYEQQGTGLGLAIVQETARLYGGSVEVESRPGEGTTVRLAVPAV